MNDITIEDFEEKEYDLESIGLKGLYLSIDQEETYLYSKDGFYSTIIDKDLSKVIKEVDKDLVKTYIIYDETQNPLYTMSEEQYKIILNLFN